MQEIVVVAWKYLGIKMKRNLSNIKILGTDVTDFLDCSSKLIGIHDVYN